MSSVVTRAVSTHNEDSVESKGRLLALAPLAPKRSTPLVVKDNTYTEDPIIAHPLRELPNDTWQCQLLGRADKVYSDLFYFGSLYTHMHT